MEQIEYTHTVVPSSMRSPYWKYFGFPSDSSNNILTRQKIVCTICNTTIAYNKNTSNLRTHLMAKHVEIFKKIVSPNVSMGQKCNTGNCAEKVVLGSNEVISTLQTDSKRAKSSSCREDAVTTNKTNIETQINNDFIAYLPSNEMELAEEIASGEGDEDVAYVINEKMLSYTDVDDSEEPERQLRLVDIMLADYIQTDLLPLNTLEEHGFCKYNQQLTGRKVNRDTIVRVRSIIETRYQNVKETVVCNVSHLSQSEPYSLGFEIYKNNEGVNVLNIYFNYLSAKREKLISILYSSSTIFTNDVDISQLLPNINLKNCTALVTNFAFKENKFVSDFASVHGLPLIECLESLLSCCLQKIFQQTEFNADYQDLLKTILQNKIVIPQKLNFKPRCKWSSLNLLEFIFSSVEQHNTGKWETLRETFQSLKPLKMVLDVIMDEPLPICSLIRPMIKKLFKDYIILMNPNETKISQIRKILENDLYDRILSDNFLKEATFFDIRFHRDFTLQETFSDITSLKVKFLNRFKNIIEVAYLDRENHVNMEQNATDPFVNIEKHSSLKLFFNRDISLNNTDATLNLKTNLDLELEQYHNQACLDLDKSPVLWWEQQSDNYKQLSKISKFYLPIPCCCLPRLCRMNIEEKYSTLDRRSSLSQFCATESKLWFLYYNEDVTALF